MGWYQLGLQSGPGCCFPEATKSNTCGTLCSESPYLNFVLGLEIKASFWPQSDLSLAVQRKIFYLHWYNFKLQIFWPSMIWESQVSQQIRKQWLFREVGLCGSLRGRMSLGEILFPVTFACVFIPAWRMARFTLSVWSNFYSLTIWDRALHLVV